MLDGITKDVGAPPNHPGVASRSETSDNPLAACFVDYKGVAKAASTLNVDRARAVAAALTGGWTEAKERDEYEAPDDTVAVVRAVFKKRGWTVVMDYRGSSLSRTLSLSAFEDSCVTKVQAAEDTASSN
ncbi:hypothetical protein P8A18_34170 (plasmid) [Streptomyces castrisilvae]|uniref:Uncharacterized protein n=1 Tax=Streptomyces castrisilvae TaxID=3033811 RepID=A0ABY9HWZ0_9ACTN|nr:hypothetical protein [Streptomyces sp. Mut1]WLQ38564.1 hypothetical protein P8A18_34170 [Streptomyces sp. Mut1]